MWSRERNCGFGPSLGGGKCGPGRETAALGQALVAGSVVRGAKSRVWVKLWWREMWSRERNRGFGSSPAPPQCGPGRKTAALGQPQPRPSVVQGAKPRPRVKPGPAAVWPRERNRGFGSNLGGGKCGPGREIAAPGQTLVAGNVVQGAKPRLRVKPDLARVWSRERNRGFGSSSAPPKYGPGRETAAPGQALPRRSVVQGEKTRGWVNPSPAAVWSVEQNRGPGSNPAPPECGPWSKTAAPGQPRPSRSMVLAPEIQKGVKTNI